MKPPVLARALIAAVAPSNDYDIITGDLFEEYRRIALSRGVTVAHRWYWSQTLVSLPSLLSYGRWNTGRLRTIRVAATAFGVLVAMIGALMIADTVFNSDLPVTSWVWPAINYSDAVIFGGILALLVRSDGLRVTFFASLFLVLCFVVPAVAGHPGSQAPLSAWLSLFGAIPAMCIGAMITQAIQHKLQDSN